MKRRLGPSRSPIVSATVNRFSQHQRARSALKWGAVSSVAMVLVLADMYFCVFSFMTSINYHVIRFTEFFILLSLFLAVLYDTVLYLGTTLRKPVYQVTKEQKQMLGILDKASEFQTVSSCMQFGSTITPDRHIKQTAPINTPFSGPVSPNQYYTPGSTHSTPSHTLSFNNSFNHTPTRSPPGGHTGNYGLPFSGSERITSITHLEQYLQLEEEREEKMKRGSPDFASSQSPGYWYGNQAVNGTSPLRKYHVATRCFSPDDNERRKDSTLVWSKIGVKNERVAQCTERCRKWLAQTIMVPMTKEIKTINSSLKKMGSTEFSIGSATLSHLKDIARLRSQHYPSLSMLIRYLELSTKQDYLVKRILELSEIGAIGNYCWDKGGSWKGRKWNPELPNDSQILLHLLCTYLDSQIPPTPQFPDGKTFTSQYLVKTPDKPESKKATVCLYQSSINPPHFKVLWRDTCIDIPVGRNNLFHSLIVFLYYIKKEEKGLLGFGTIRPQSALGNRRLTID